MRALNFYGLACGNLAEGRRKLGGSHTAFHDTVVTMGSAAVAVAASAQLHLELLAVALAAAASAVRLASCWRLLLQVVAE